MTILKLENLSTSYGLSKALFDVSLEISKGELVSLIGRNGVGKTTTMRSIMGLAQPNTGKVYWKGVDITGRAPNKNARDGIGFVPEDRRIFSDLTVWENLDVARQDRPDYLTAWNEERIFELFPDLLK
ncbi:MAG: ABC transporter ATP-binding protein, partial [Magnetovibrio sp.]|nr:ABC transporter ATP-binding protein [Magnetovibrio sp.]